MYINEAVHNGHISGNGVFTKRAEALLSQIHNDATTLLTTSCTHALEMSARLLDLQPGDEVIVPSYTFVSTASAFMWNGAKPVFADIRLDTMNLDPDSVSDLISERTRAICLVHYAGVGADPTTFAEISHTSSITLIEDNAHGLSASFDEKTLGTFGSISTLSFHETKNISCGEGGAIILNDPALVARAEVLREKGTDRSRFLRGQVDKYTWIDNGSSWVMSDLLAAVLVAQLERMDIIQQGRLAIWDRYFECLSEWGGNNNVSLPYVPENARHSAHMFYLRLPTLQDRDRFIQHMRSEGVMTVFHYQALDTSPEGLRIGGGDAHCPNSKIASDTLVRLPLFNELTASDQNQVIDAALKFSV